MNNHLYILTSIETDERVYCEKHKPTHYICDAGLSPNACYQCLEDDKLTMQAMEQAIPVSFIHERTQLYLSGPISGRVEANIRRFNLAERVIRKQHPAIKIFNPASNDQSLSYAKQMEVDLIEVCRSGQVLMLLGWEQSKGAKIEYEVAIVTGKHILYELDQNEKNQ